MLKILYIACKHDYARPEIGLSFDYYNLYDSLVKMNNGENQVLFFPIDQISKDIGKEKMQKGLLDFIDKERPDFCIFFLFGDYLEKETIKKITDSGKTITFSWFADDKWRFDNFTKYWAPLFNWVSTDQVSSLKKYKKIGYKNVIVGGWACNQFLYRPMDLPKEYDVTFVGQPHGNRKKIINAIKKAGINVQCFGRGWSSGRISQEDMIKVFSQSKINLNFSKCSGGFGLNYFARIFIDKKENGSLFINSLKYWPSNAKSFLARSQNEIKGRNFEIPGCRAFLLTGYAKGIEEYYKLNKEIVCFYSTKDLIEKIKYYLHHQEEREQIAKAGYERTLADHTYEKRFNEIFKKIGLIK